MSTDDPDLPTIKRNVVRLVVLDTDERILLLHVQDLGNPQFGTVWELPGGGIEAGETYAQAAVRELYEETGLEIDPLRLSAPSWHREAAYVYRGTRWLQHELVAAVRVRAAEPSIRDTHRLKVEKDDVLNARWWTLQEIAQIGERFYPRSLPELLPRFLQGESLDEPLEKWS